MTLKALLLTLALLLLLTQSEACLWKCNYGGGGYGGYGGYPSYGGYGGYPSYGGYGGGYPQYGGGGWGGSSAQASASASSWGK